jgi:hypothetical protein
MLALMFLLCLVAIWIGLLWWLRKGLEKAAHF